MTEEAPPGEALYGIFLRACNISKDQRTSASEFTVTDNQDNSFQPEPLPVDNPFAYTPRTLDPEECIPEAGSVAQLGPTAGSMLLFKFPLENTENRPLELEIEQRRREAHVRAGHLAPAPGRSRAPASSTTRAAGAAVAPPAPARTSITPTAIGAGPPGA